jgi:hypothetical protein
MKMVEIIRDEIADEKEDLTTLFAVRTTINQESNILNQIFYRFKILDVIVVLTANKVVKSSFSSAISSRIISTIFISLLSVSFISSSWSVNIFHESHLNLGFI